MHDIWHLYLWQNLAVLLAGAIFLLLVIRLFTLNRELINSEERYRTVADFTLDWEYWLAPDGNFIYCSPSCQQATGYNAAAFYADPSLLYNIIHPDDKKLFSEHRQATNTGVIQVDSISFRIIHPDGSIHWIEHICHTVFNDAGLNKGIRGSNRDITERKQVSIDLAQREQAHANSERLLKIIIDTEPECVKLLDSDCNLLMMNPAGLKMIDADSLEHVKGQCMCSLITDTYRDAFIALTKQVFQGIPGSLKFETFGLKGRHVWLETHAVPLRNEHDKIVALLGLTQDITERKRAEDEIQHLTANLATRAIELENANQELEAFNHSTVTRVPKILPAPVLGKTL